MTTELNLKTSLFSLTDIVINYFIVAYTIQLTQVAVLSPGTVCPDMLPAFRTV